MQKIVKNSFYWLVWGLSLFQTTITDAAIDLWWSKVQDTMKWSTEAVDQSVQTLITAALAFLYLLAVIYWLWGGFNILTAGWDEEKVKKWKTIIIHAIVWLIVIWLVGSIIQWVVTQLLQTT